MVSLYKTLVRPHVDFVEYCVSAWGPYYKKDKQHLEMFNAGLLQELTRRWDSERELFYDDIAHVLQNTEKRTYFV